MKILIYFLLFTSYFSFAQSVTEKWNSLSSRYEYFDGNGNLVGTKTYNNFTNSWTYTPVNNNYNNPYGTPYDTSAIDLGFQIASMKQKRYDDNRAKIQSEIDHIYTTINNSDYNESLKTRIRNRFTYEYLNNINKQFKNKDLSSSALTSQIINWIYSGVNKIKKEESVTENRNVNENAFNGYYKVSSVEEFAFNGSNWTLSYTDRTNTIFDFEGSYLTFKRSQSPATLTRELEFLGYDDQTKENIYDSPYGKVIIYKDFSKVILYDLRDVNGNDTKKYIFNLEYKH